MKFFLLALLILLLSGMALAPWEKKLAEPEGIFLEQQELSELKALLGAPALLALVEGFRAPLAILLWMKIEVCWENKNWEFMRRFLDLVLWIEPHCIPYYTMAAWQLGWNASSDMQEEQQSHFYIDQARVLLEKGILKNPKSSLLYETLGVLLRDRLHNHAAAAAAFTKAAASPGAHSYLSRFANYELECAK